MQNYSEKITFNYKRILVVGPPGAGKTSFCKRLAKKINEPLYHLDDYYWLKDWRRLPRDEWVLLLTSLCNRPSWIIDGNHANTFKLRAGHADVVIMLDYLPMLCMWRFAVRSLKRYFKINDNLPKNIEIDGGKRPRFRIQWHLIKLILFYRKKVKVEFLNYLTTLNCPVVVLKKSCISKRFVDSLLVER